MVISLLERMKSEKVEPNTIVLTAAIDSLARDGGGQHTGSTYTSTPALMKPYLHFAVFIWWMRNFRRQLIF